MKLKQILSIITALAVASAAVMSMTLVTADTRDNVDGYDDAKVNDYDLIDFEDMTADTEGEPEEAEPEESESEEVDPDPEETEPELQPGDVVAEGDFAFKLLEDGTLAVTGYNGSEEFVQIPAEAAERAVTAISDGAAIGGVWVYVPETVTYIGENAFGNADGLTIFGYSNAESYAAENGLQFFAAGGETLVDNFYEVEVTLQEFYGAVLNISEGYHSGASEGVYFNVSLSDGAGAVIQPESSLLVKIKVPLGWTGKTVGAYSVDADGTVQEINSLNLNGYIAFFTDSLGEFMIAPQEATEPEPDEGEETTDPEETTEPEETEEPEPEPEPEVTTTPITTTAPESAEPDVTSEPEVTDQPEDTTDPEITTEPEDTEEPEETSEPEDVTEPDETEEEVTETEPEVTTTEAVTTADTEAAGTEPETVPTEEELTTTEPVPDESEADTTEALTAEDSGTSEPDEAEDTEVSESEITEEPETTITEEVVTAEEPEPAPEEAEGDSDGTTTVPPGASIPLPGEEATEEADETDTVSSAIQVAPTIDVTVPSNISVIINPYGMNINLDGVDYKASGVSSPVYTIINKTTSTDVKVEASAFLTVPVIEYTDGAGVTAVKPTIKVVDNPAEVAAASEKTVCAYVLALGSAVQCDRYYIDNPPDLFADGDPDFDESTLVFADASVEAKENSCTLITLDKAEEDTFTYAQFRISGNITDNSVDEWTDSDVINVNLVLCIMPVEEDNVEQTTEDELIEE